MGSPMLKTMASCTGELQPLDISGNVDFNKR